MVADGIRNEVYGLPIKVRIAAQEPDCRLGAQWAVWRQDDVDIVCSGTEMCPRPIS